MNQVNLIGRLTRDIELRYSGETAVAKFNVAIDRPPKKDGTKGADFPSIVAFGATAENIEKYFHKGARIGITGHIQTGSYERDDGTKVYTTDVMVDRFDFIEKKDQGSTDAFDKISDEEIPF